MQRLTRHVSVNPSHKDDESQVLVSPPRVLFGWAYTGLHLLPTLLFTLVDTLESAIWVTKGGGGSEKASTTRVERP